MDDGSDILRKMCSLEVFQVVRRNSELFHLLFSTLLLEGESEFNWMN